VGGNVRGKEARGVTRWDKEEGKMGWEKPGGRGGRDRGIILLGVSSRVDQFGTSVVKSITISNLSQFTRRGGR